MSEGMSAKDRRYWEYGERTAREVRETFPEWYRERLCSEESRNESGRRQQQTGSSERSKPPRQTGS